MESLFFMAALPSLHTKYLVSQGCSGFLEALSDNYSAYFTRWQWELNEITHVKCLMVLPRLDSKMFSMMTMMLPPPRPHPHTDPLRKPGMVCCLLCRGSHAFLLPSIKPQTLHLSLILCCRNCPAVRFLSFLFLSAFHTAVSPLCTQPWRLMMTVKSQGKLVNLLTK